MASASSTSAKSLFADSKSRLADRVQNNVNNIASLTRQIQRGSKTNEIIMTSARNFVAQEQTIANSESASTINLFVWFILLCSALTIVGLTIAPSTGVPMAPGYGATVSKTTLKKTQQMMDRMNYDHLSVAKSATAITEAVQQTAAMQR